MAVQPLSPATDRRLGRPLPHQLSNQTRAHLSAIKSLTSRSCGQNVSCGISGRFQPLSPSERQVAHALLTRSPLTRGASSSRPFDLHVLGTPPAFVLSQDQTLYKMVSKHRRFFIAHAQTFLLEFALATQEITLTFSQRFMGDKNRPYFCPWCLFMFFVV